MKKHLAFYLGWSAFLLLLAGCEQSDSPTDSAGNGKPITVDFTVAGIADYGDNQTTGSRAANSPAPFSVSVPISGEYEMEATFTPDPPTTSRATATRAALGEGVYYRVVAYKKSTTPSAADMYAGYADYKIVNGSSSLESAPLTLEGGNYWFAAYSYNNSNPITDDPPKKAIVVNIDNDILRWEEEKTISEHTALSISFKHLFTQMKVKFDATELGIDFNAAKATLAAQSGLPKEGTWALGTDYITDLEVSPHTSEFNFSNIGGQAITSDPQRLLLRIQTGLKLTVSASFAAGGGMAPVNKTLTLVDQVYSQNTSYTCTVKFKPSGLSLDGNDVDGYPFGGGNCWLIHDSKAPGTFSFDATKEGQSTDPLGTTVTPNDASRAAKLVWESKPGMISETIYANGRIRFRVNFPYCNALLAVTDGTGQILWSWHIWVADVYIDNSPNRGDFLESNLGRNSLDPGLFYQFGRKDPIRPEDRLNQMSGPVDVATSIQNPDKFIMGDEYGRWCTTSILNTWQNNKKHNPCPKGFIVPSSTAFTGMSLANVNSGWQSGYYWPRIGHFSAGGMRRSADGGLDRVGKAGYYRTQSTEGTGSVQFYISEGIVQSNNVTNDLATGYLVRCIRE